MEPSIKPTPYLGPAISACIAVFLSFALGCGGSSGTSTTTVTSPSNLVYPQTTITATVGTAITPNIPTVTGTVNSYAVSPALPVGLSLNSSTGAISGTPTAVAAQATYTVTAMNSAGSTATTIQIAANAAVTPPSNLVYPQTTITAIVGAAITSDTPAVSGTVNSYTVSPTLPAGLSLDSSTGTISGTPTAVAAQATYTVTAMNSAGATSAMIQITVNASPQLLLELGHSAQIALLRFQNSRVLSQDTSGHWALWDYLSGANIVNGGQGSTLPVDLAGNTVVIGIPNQLQVRSSLDGHVLSTIASSSSWWKLATDGSYVCAGSTTGLSAWMPTGQLLFSIPGDYSAAKSFATPSEVLVALGPKGANVIETVAVPNGTSSISPPFSGQFNSWFVDGQRFLTNISNTVWTYSNTGVQQAIVTLPTTTNLTGQGNWIWVESTFALNIYAIGSSTPAASYPVDCCTTLIPSAMTIGVMQYGNGPTSVVDLSGSSPTKIDYTLPVAYNLAYAAISTTQWLVGNIHGVIVDGQSLSSSPRYLGLGQAWSITGGAGRVAVATASGSIIYANPVGTAIEGTIGFSSSKLEMSSDGTVLAAMANANDAQYEPDRTLKVFSLPSATLINSWPYDSTQYPVLFDFSLSGSGTMIGQVLGSWNGSNWNYTRQVTAATGGPIIWSDNVSNSPIQLSPDGTLIAVSDRPFPLPPSFTNPSFTTTISRNGTLVTAVPGWAVGWIDNGRLLVNNYTTSHGLVIYAGATIYDPTGTVLATSTIPQLQEFQTVTSDWVYSPASNTIFSLTTGAAVWTGVNPALGVGAISGPYAVYSSGSGVFVESY